MRRRNKNYSRTRMQVLMLYYISSINFLSNSNPDTKAKGQLTKANQTKTKMENLARELQKVRPCPLIIPSISVTYCLYSRTTNGYECVGNRNFYISVINGLVLGGWKAFGEQR